jgi:tape measure domain-containing protein
MNNTIEFVLRMKDMMSSNITRVSSTSQSAFSRMSQQADRMTGRNRILAMSFSEIQNRIREVENTISRSTIPSQIAAARRELAMLQRQSANHAGNVSGGSSSSSGIGIGGVAVGSMIGNLASRGATMVVGAVTGGISKMISRSMQKEQAITGLTTFLGKQGATEAYRNIRKDADVTPFDTATLLTVNRALISTGLSAEKSRADAMNLANAVSAVGGGNPELERMAVNMQQIKSIGKATSIDIRQFGIAGINIYEMLARSTGKSIAQVKEMDITYEQLSESLAMANAKGGIYEGALAAQSQTRAGKWSTVKDLAGNAASDLGDAFSPVITKLLDMAIQFAGSIGPMIAQAQPYIDAFSTGIGRAVDYVKDIVNGTSEWQGWIERVQEVFSGIWAIVVPMATKVWNIVKSMIEFIQKSEILKDIFSFIGGILTFYFTLFSSVIDLVSWAWDNVFKPILEALDRAYKWIKGTKDIEVKSTKTVIAPKPKNNDPSGSPIGTGGAMMASNNASGKTAGETVSGAGPKVVNIHVGKFFDNIQFTTMNGKESAQELENIVMEALARVLYNGSKLV